LKAAWSTILQPGPLRAFYQRVRARRGHGKAIVATARKLAILFWCMLTRSEDYAHQQPSLTRKKMRRLEITAGAAKNTRRSAGIWSTNELMRTAERGSQSKPRPPTSAWSKTNKPARQPKLARVRHRSAHQFRSLNRGQSSAADQSSKSALRYVVTRADPTT
jgi:hypothetical protein